MIAVLVLSSPGGRAQIIVPAGSVHPSCPPASRCRIEPSPYPPLDARHSHLYSRCFMRFLPTHLLVTSTSRPIRAHSRVLHASFTRHSRASIILGRRPTADPNLRYEGPTQSLHRSDTEINSRNSLIYARRWHEDTACCSPCQWPFDVSAPKIFQSPSDRAYARRTTYLHIRRGIERKKKSFRDSTKFPYAAQV